MTPRDGVPSWDAASAEAPARPAFASSLPPIAAVARPRRLAVVFVLTLVAALLFVVVTTQAAMRLDEVRAALSDAIPDDLRDDYADDDIRRATRLLVGVIGALGLVLTLAQLMAMRSLALRRRPGARVMFVIVVLLFLPVSALSASVRAGGRLDEGASAVAAVCLIVSMVIICTRRVSAWLRQPEHRDPILLVDPEDPNCPGDPEDREGSGHAEPTRVELEDDAAGVSRRTRRSTKRRR